MSVCSAVLASPAGLVRPAQRCAGELREEERAVLPTTLPVSGAGPTGLTSCREGPGLARLVFAVADGALLSSICSFPFQSQATPVACASP